MEASLEEKEIIRLNDVSTIADGIAVKSPGTLTYDLCCKYVDEVVTVSEEEIAAAILTLLEKMKMVAEGAGATSVAAAMFARWIWSIINVLPYCPGELGYQSVTKIIDLGLIKPDARQLSI